MADKMTDEELAQLIDNGACVELIRETTGMSQLYRVPLTQLMRVMSGQQEEPSVEPPAGPERPSWLPNDFKLLFNPDLYEAEILPAKGAKPGTMFIAPWNKWNVPALKAGNEDDGIKGAEKGLHWARFNVVTRGIRLFVRPYDDKIKGWPAGMMSREMAEALRPPFYYEVEMAMQVYPGIHVALWMLPVDGSYLRNPSNEAMGAYEIDIVEHINGQNKVHVNYHAPGDHFRTIENVDPGQPHRYGLYWDAAGLLHWYFDGQKVMSKNGTQMDGKAFYGLLTLEVDSHWTGPMAKDGRSGLVEVTSWRVWAPAA